MMITFALNNNDDITTLNNNDDITALNDNNDITTFNIILLKVHLITL